MKIPSKEEKKKRAGFEWIITALFLRVGFVKADEVGAEWPGASVQSWPHPHFSLTQSQSWKKYLRVELANFFCKSHVIDLLSFKPYQDCCHYRRVISGPPVDSNIANVQSACIMAQDLHITSTVYFKSYLGYLDQVQCEYFMNHYYTVLFTKWKQYLYIFNKNSFGGGNIFYLYMVVSVDTESGLY